MKNNENHIETADVVVIGGGPGGSCLSAYLAQAGVNVMTLEKETFLGITSVSR